jgi:uncharacterized protein (TIGR02145 family)
LKKVLILCLFAFCFASAAKKSLAVMPCVGDFDAKGLERLRNKIEEVTRAVLPSADFRMIPYKNVQEEIGDEALFNACKEGGVCFGDLAGRVNADYGAWCMVNKYSNKFIFTFQLYSVREKDLIHTKEYDSYNPKNIDDMIEIIKKEVPIVISEKIPGVKISKTPSPAIAGGISGVQTTGGSYELEGGKRYLINLSTEPVGAVLSFNGVPDSRCSKTPCKIELSAGNVRIIANLEQYEIADTTVSIKQNNQSINIKLKANFGVLEIKPAYSDGIGKDKQWNLSINDKPYSLGEVRLNPNKYKVKLNHECYENIGFDVGINKDKREIFDMASKIALKKGGLDLSVERNGEPASEPVFVNGKQVGETPFSGAVPLCAKIEIGKNKEVVGVKLKYNEKVKHTHKGAESQEGKYLTDSRDGKKYKIVKIGTQTWMAENLNYSGKNDDIGSCYEKNPKNCEKYGRLYDGNTAMKACPAGWHLPSDKEWDILENFAGGQKIAGKKLKTKNGWNNRDDGSSGNGTDDFGFSALPGGSFGDYGRFDYVGRIGLWWNSSESGSYYSHSRSVRYDYEYADYSRIDERYLLSVRCIKDNNAAPSIKGNTFTDPRDGKVYKTAKIGAQTWMAENLKYNAENSKCAGNCGSDGQLYNWETAKRSCPKSWHLPSKEEWETLVNFAGGKDIAGKKLKASKGWSFIGTSGGGTDDYGFTARPRGLIGCGRKNCSEQPLVRDDCDHWWSDYGDDDQAFGWFICKKNDWTSLSSFAATYLLSVRCIKD